jgi:hypothetical protein
MASRAAALPRQIGHESRLAAPWLTQQQERGRSGRGEERVHRLAHPAPADEVLGAAVNQLAVVDDLVHHGFTHPSAGSDI